MGSVPEIPFGIANELTRTLNRWLMKVRQSINDVEASLETIPTEVTISGGEVTLTGTKPIRYIRVDTDGGAAADDLSAINGGNPGELLFIESSVASRVVTVKNNSVIRLQQIDFILNSPYDKLSLICLSSGIWHEFGRASNG